MNHKEQLEQIRSWGDQLRYGDISRRRFLSLAAGMSSTALLAACAGGGQTSTSGNKRMIPFYTNENDPATLAFFNAVIKKFEADHSDVTVTVNSWDGSVPTTLRNLQSGRDLGVFNVNTASAIPAWASADLLLPLTDLVKDIGGDDFLPGTRIKWRGDDYAMPYQANSSLLYCRADILDQHGMKPPTTYDEFRSIVSELHGRDHLIGIATVAGEGNLIPKQFVTPYIYQSGWDFFGPDGTVTFGEPEVLEGLQRYIDIMRHTRASLYNGGYADITTAYTSGRAVFATFPGRLGVNVADQAPKVASGTKVIGIPAGPFMTGKLHHGTLAMYAVAAKTAAPEEAKDFVRELTTGQAAVDYAMTVPGHLLPALKSVATAMGKEIDASKKPYVTKHGDWIETFLDNVDSSLDPATSMGAVNNHDFGGRTANIAPWSSTVWGGKPLDRTLVQNVLIKKSDLASEWRTMTAKLNKIVRDYRDKNPDWKPSK